MDISKSDFINKVEELKGKFKKFGKDGIQANIDGPIVPCLYYDAPIKIMWILQESYRGNENDIGGHNSSEDKAHYASMADWEKREEGKQYGYKAFLPIVSIAWQVYNNFIEFDEEEAISEKAYNDFKRSTAIINVKRIPDIGSKNTREIITWAKCEQNIELIKEQIKLYVPQIIIGGHTLNSFFTKGKEKDKHIPRNIKEDFTLLGEFISKKDVYESNGNYIYYNNKVLFINAYHPSYPAIKPQDYCNNIIKVIKDWTIEKKFKLNI